METWELAILSALTYWVNGLLAIVYLVAAHWPAVAAWGVALYTALRVDSPAKQALATSAARYRRGRTAVAPRRMFDLTTLLLGTVWVAVAWVTPAPVPHIGLAMWAGTLIPLGLPAGQTRALHRLRWFIGVYALLNLGFFALARFPLSPAQAAAWSARLQAAGAGEALEFAIRAQFIPYVALVIWGVYPLTYFGYVAQQVGIARRFRHDPALTPAQRAHSLRFRDEV